MGFTVYGLDDLMNSFGNLAELPDAVVDEMLNAQADEVVAAQKRTAGSMLTGPYTRRIVQGAVKKNSRIQRTKDGKVLHITFEGTVYGPGRPRKGNRAAEIAFINEFGKIGQPARPFIETANEESADGAVEKAAAIYDRHLQSIGL